MAMHRAESSSQVDSFPRLQSILKASTPRISGRHENRGFRTSPERLAPGGLAFDFKFVHPEGSWFGPLFSTLQFLAGLHNCMGRSI